MKLNNIFENSYILIPKNSLKNLLNVLNLT